MRNFVLLVIACHVPIRLEPWKYLTTQMVKDAVPGKDVYQITIKASHKTLASHGFPKPGIPKSVFHKLQSFVEITHRHFFHAKSESFFKEMTVFCSTVCSTDGKPLSISSLSHEVICSTGYRKFMSTLAQMRGETDLALSKSFLHSADTARKHNFAGEVGQEVFGNNFAKCMALTPALEKETIAPSRQKTCRRNTRRIKK